MMGNLFNSKDVLKVEYSSDGENWHELGFLSRCFLKETRWSKIKRWIKIILCKSSVSFKQVKYSEKHKMPIDNLIKRWK